MRGGDTFEVKAFTDGIEFFAAARTLYDIVYIGCVMSKMDGMRVAKKIREYDAETALVLADEDVSYAVKGYEVSAADFLKKPVAFSAFTQGLVRIMENLENSEKALSIRAKRGYARVAVRKVEYVEKDKNYIVYHTYSGDIRERGVIGEKKEILTCAGFSRINSGCFVNLMFVKQADGASVTVGDRILPISKSCKGEFYADFERYLKNQTRV